ncbi:hypothetical protein BX666DRAFT_1981988 [Dichotomocladium elegans]|nr:hypothetical protein BX666DRAFT_1981988 [Dichotomocladium elegans]
MDIYALTRKKRPTHLTLGQPTRPSGPPETMIDSPTLTEQSSLDSKRPSPSSISSLSDGAVTGPPTRDHWKPDADATHCAYFGCRASFGLFERRHHCRKCGDIFCSTHCSNYLRLNQASQFHPKGVLCRGCDSCANEYLRWQQQEETKDTPSSQSAEVVVHERKDHHHHHQSYISRRRAGIMTPPPQAMEGVTELGRDDIVEPSPHPKGVNIKPNVQVAFNPIPSVPADWQWSTF